MEQDFQHIIDQNYGILYKIGRAYTRSQVDFQDLYQEMLVQLWQAYPRFRGQSKLSTFIYRVALNTALNYQRKQKRHKTSEIPPEHHRAWIDHSPTEREHQHEQEQRLQLLYVAINQLKKEDRALILLHLDGKSYEEMAEIMGITVNNIGVRLLRCKKRLHKHLVARGYARV